MGADQNFTWAAYAATTLDWWQEAGVDASIDEAARNWLRPVSPPGAAQPAKSVTEFAPAIAAAPVTPLPDTLAAFEAWRVGPDAPEASWPGIAIGAHGKADADLMILIDQSERDDADTGILMSGAVGRLFDRMLAAIGHDRSSIYLVAVAAKRPPAGRIAPDIELRLNEIAQHHVSLAAPKMLLLLGNAPSRALLGADAARLRGSLHAINAAEGKMAAIPTQAVASFHPRFLLERPSAKAEAWKDLQMLTGGMPK